VKEDSVFYHDFVKEFLSKRGFKMVLISEDYLRNNFDHIKLFVNSARKEFFDVYNWKEEPDEYFYKHINGKWKYSFGIFNEKSELTLLNFSSLNGNRLHYHFTYVAYEYRNRNLAKIHSLKLSQHALDNNLTEQEGFWPPNNILSINLYQKLGWTIQEQLSKDKLLLVSDIKTVRDNSFRILSEKILTA
jgi:hypothetical protein